MNQEVLSPLLWPDTHSITAPRKVGNALLTGICDQTAEQEAQDSDDDHPVDTNSAPTLRKLQRTHLHARLAFPPSPSSSRSSRAMAKCSNETQTIHGAKGDNIHQLKLTKPKHTTSGASTRSPPKTHTNCTFYDPTLSSQPTTQTSQGYDKPKIFTKNIARAPQAKRSGTCTSGVCC